MGEFNWVKDLALPILLSFFCSYVYSRSGRLLRSTKSKAARKKYQAQIKRALRIVLSDLAGGFSAMVSLAHTHLLVRCTAFLFGFIATMVFYAIMVITKDDKGSYFIIFMGICCGVLLNMIRTVLEDIGEMIIAHTSPVAHVEELEANRALASDPEFAEQLARIRQYAQDMEDRRKGFAGAQMLATRMMHPTEEAAPPSASASS
ncbi:hypothetical protein [Methylobacterium sp. Leaf89]|uniref:hypothetical protein n=1 Tax=Methylobacterium sp. Leaf89 TaxID=1736245 RepID=UPI0012E8FE33|nr:hypothetical protein [Methylobacterium sp. Leaf89]